MAKSSWSFIILHSSGFAGLLMRFNCGLLACLPLDDSLTLCIRALVIINRGQGNDPLTGHVLPVLLPNAFLQGWELGTELMVQISLLNGEDSA